MRFNLSMLGFQKVENTYSDGLLNIEDGTRNFTNGVYETGHIPTTIITNEFFKKRFACVRNSLSDIPDEKFLLTLLESYREILHFLFVRFIQSREKIDATTFFKSHIYHQMLYFKKDKFFVIKAVTETYKKTRFKPGDNDTYTYDKVTKCFLLIMEPTIEYAEPIIIDYSKDEYLKSILPSNSFTSKDEYHFHNQDEYEIIEFRILALEKKNIDIEREKEKIE